MTTFTYGSVYRTLLACDADGVRIGITTEKSRRKLRRAIERAYANHAENTASRPRVSRAAEAHLGLAFKRTLVAHTLLALALLTVSVSLYVAAVLRLGSQ